MATKNRKEENTDKITLKSFLEQGLRDGISSIETEEAEQIEQMKERDVTKDEQ